MTEPGRRRPWWLFAIALVVVVGAGLGIGALVWDDGDKPAAASPEIFPGWTQDDRDQCLRDVLLTFSGDQRDQQMHRAANALRDDPDFESLLQRTQQESFEHSKRIFAAQPELLELLRLEAMPAVIIGTVRGGISADEVKGRVQARFPDAEVRTQDYC